MFTSILKRPIAREAFAVSVAIICSASNFHRFEHLGTMFYLHFRLMSPEPMI